MGTNITECVSTDLIHVVLVAYGADVEQFPVWLIQHQLWDTVTTGTEYCHECETEKQTGTYSYSVINYKLSSIKENNCHSLCVDGLDWVTRYLKMSLPDLNSLDMRSLNLCFFQLSIHVHNIHPHLSLLGWGFFSEKLWKYLSHLAKGRKIGLPERCPETLY